MSIRGIPGETPRLATSLHTLGRKGLLAQRDCLGSHLRSRSLRHGVLSREVFGAVRVELEFGQCRSHSELETNVWFLAVSLRQSLLAPKYQDAGCSRFLFIHMRNRGYGFSGYLASGYLLCGVRLLRWRLERVPCNLDRKNGHSQISRSFHREQRPVHIEKQATETESPHVNYSAPRKTGTICCCRIRSLREELRETILD